MNIVFLNIFTCSRFKNYSTLHWFKVRSNPNVAKAFAKKGQTPLDGWRCMHYRKFFRFSSLYIQLSSHMFSSCFTIIRLWGRACVCPILCPSLKLVSWDAWKRYYYIISVSGKEKGVKKFALRRGSHIRDLTESTPLFSSK